MVETSEEYRQRIIRLTEERHDFVADAAGYYIFWITGCGGMTANDLRILADELDRKNTEWDANVQQYFKC